MIYKKYLWYLFLFYLTLLGLGWWLFLHPLSVRYAEAIKQQKETAITAAAITPPPSGNREKRVLDFDKADLSDVITTMTTAAHKNVVLSGNITGVVSLHLTNVDPELALNFLLASQGLAVHSENKIMYIAPQSELETANLQSKTWHLRYADAKLLQAQDSLLSKQGQIHIDNRTNTIYVKDTAKQIKAVNQWIKSIDVPVPQIAVEVRLASVDVDYEQELGVNFSVASGAENEPGCPGRYSLAIAKLADRTLLDVKLSALENAGRAELISSPRLFTLNQQPSAIEAGEEVPYQEVSQSGGTAIVFKKAVLGLKVTPQILPDKQVMLEIQVNQDRPSNKMVLGMPTISTRQLTSHVVAKNGQTIVLGGIYEHNTEFAEQRLPGVSQIPIFGWLFKQRNKRISKRELLIFVTPIL